MEPGRELQPTEERAPDEGGAATRARKVAALQAKIGGLEAQLVENRRKEEEIRGQLKSVVGFFLQGGQMCLSRLYSRGVSCAFIKGRMTFHHMIISYFVTFPVMSRTHPLRPSHHFCHSFHLHESYSKSHPSFLFIHIIFTHLQKRKKKTKPTLSLCSLLHHTLLIRTLTHPIPHPLRTSSPETTVQNHITLLHTYNQIRDIGTGLMGIIAENRGVRVRDVYREFGVGETD
jgi:hypothetical protein